MSTLKYIQVSPGIKIGVPVELTPEEIEVRVKKFKSNLEKGKQQHYNPIKKTYLKSKF